jgi:Fic family protein
MDLRERYRARVQEATRGAANQLVDLTFERPVLTSRIVETRLGISRPAALTALRQLAELGVLHSAADGPRGQRRWRAKDVLTILTEGT